MAMKKPFLYVALDSVNRDDMYRAAEDLAGVDRDNFGYKVNLDLVVRNDPGFVTPLVEMGRPVFVDMKMWNGRRTMSSVAEEFGALGVSAINMYSHAGVKFLKAVGDVASIHDMQLFGVTVLTHYTDDDCQRIYRCDLREAVRRLASIAYDGDCDGVILPGTTLDVVEGLDMTKVVPAIRPEWWEDKKANYQEQPVTPREAVERGADILVCGSPILKSENPQEALLKISDEMGL